MNQSQLRTVETRRPWASLVLVVLLLGASGVVWLWEAHGGKERFMPLMQRLFPIGGEATQSWRLLSAMGTGWILTVCLLCWLLVSRAPERVLWCLLALAAAGLVVAMLKGLIGRVRPDGGDRTAWPSGHSAAVFAVATLFPSERVRMVAAYPFAMLVGCARVALQRHFPADVLAGAAFGVLCGVVLQRWHQAAPAWLRSPALALVAGAALFGICVLRGGIDFQVRPLLGVFGAPLFLGCVLARLLRNPQAHQP
jgi:membrane-associated phospholipid phosphatase